MEPNANRESLRNQVTIRQFQPQDRTAVLNVYTRALSVLGLPTRRGPNNADFDDIQGIYINKNGDFLVGEIDGQIVATGGYTQMDQETAFIRRMYTLPEYQGKEIGDELLKKLEESIRKKPNYKKISLFTTTKMPNAIKLYESTGYHEVKRIPEPEAGFGKDYAGIFFEKSIETL